MKKKVKKMNTQQRPAIQVKRAEEMNSKAVVAFLTEQRSALFPMLSAKEQPADILQFESFYTESAGGAFFVACSEEGKVMGTIGLCPYDGRLKQIAGLYDESVTAEVVRCYIDPVYRRLGIGTILFQAVEKEAERLGYRTLYLHTHPFLPGGIPFWQHLGFQERLAEDDPVWQTLHMDRLVRKESDRGTE